MAQKLEGDGERATNTIIIINPFWLCAMHPSHSAFRQLQHATPHHVDHQLDGIGLAWNACGWLVILWVHFALLRHQTASHWHHIRSIHNYRSDQVVSWNWVANLREERHPWNWVGLELQSRSIVSHWFPLGDTDKCSLIIFNIPHWHHIRRTHNYRQRLALSLRIELQFCNNRGRIAIGSPCDCSSGAGLSFGLR